MTFATKLVAFVRAPRVRIPCDAILLVGFLGSALAGNAASYLVAVLALIWLCADIYKLRRRRRQEGARDE